MPGFLWQAPRWFSSAPGWHIPPNSSIYLKSLQPPFPKFHLSIKSPTMDLFFIKYSTLGFRFDYCLVAPSFPLSLNIIFQASSSLCLSCTLFIPIYRILLILPLQQCCSSSLSPPFCHTGF